MVNLPLPLQHLQLRLHTLNVELSRAIENRRETTRRQAVAVGLEPAEPTEGKSDPFAFLQLLHAMSPQARAWISDSQVDFLISEVEALVHRDGELPAEHRLRAEAKHQGIVLPLDRLESELPLSATQMDAVILCAAPEFDPAYETLYAYILNDVTRRMPCPELFCALTDAARERCDRRLELSRYSRLRLAGVVVPVGTSATELRQELRLAPGLFEFLLDGRGDPADLCRDLDEVNSPLELKNPPQVDSAELKRVGLGLKTQVVQVVGIWGPRQAGPDEVAQALAMHADRPLRRWTMPDPRSFEAGHERSLRDAIGVASVLDAILWIQTDAITDQSAPDPARLGEALTEQLASAQVRTILSGTRPWQPARLLAARPFQAIQLQALDKSQRRTIWHQAAPTAPPAVLDELAARYSMTLTEARAAASVSATTLKLASAPVNGSAIAPARLPPAAALEAASAALDRQSTSPFTTLINPVRGPDDLVLPEPLKTQVLEIADFHRAWPDVCGQWGFGRIMTGPGGIKALFHGEPGTGKTLAAEVIAKQLGRPLLKLDLAQLVSRWVGETEKHLHTAFCEAAERDSVLCIDEADALLGKRGEIRYGTDRYANLEVSYLLQRLEEHPGLVLMASNHKENIDEAFMRRFQAAFSFPRPAHDQRRAIWELAFPNNPAYQLDQSVKFDELARLDMTGAAIVESARTAALLAAKAAHPAERPAVTLKHIADAVKRLFQREARLLSARELRVLGEGP